MSAAHPPSFTREAFAESALAIRERLWGFALQLCRSQADAEDLLQVTYMRGFERWTQLRELDCIAAWLTQMMRRTFVDQCRRKKCVRMDPLSVLVDDPVDGRSLARRTEARDSVQKAFSALSPLLAEAVALCDIWEFSYIEISELLGCPIGTVRSRIARGRAQLAEQLSAVDMPTGVDTLQERVAK